MNVVPASASPGAPGAVADRVLALSARAPRRALRIAREALDGRRDLPPEARARLLRASGHALRAVGDYAAARTAYRESRRLYRRLALPQEWAIGAIGLVDACMYLGRTEEALEAAATARPVFVRQRDARRLAMLETNVGNVHHRAESLEEALQRYQRAARLLKRHGSPVERAGVDHNIANALTFLGRRREAEALYRSAIDAFARAGHRIPAAQARYGIACLRFLSGEYAAAIAELEAVRPELLRLGARPLCALADLDLAEVLLAIRLYPEALALARSAERWFRTHGIATEQARCLLATGIALTHLDRPARASRDLERAGRIFRAIGMEPGRAAVALGRARLAAQAGRPTAAAHLAIHAYRVFQRRGFRLRALAAGAVAAESHLAAGRIARARSLARAVSNLRRQPGDSYSRARLARVEGAAVAGQGSPAGALVHYRRALLEAARSRSALFVDEWRMGFIEGEPAIVEEALDILLTRRPAARASEVWKWLARSGVSARSGPAASPPPVGPDVRRRAAVLRDELKACYARLWRQQGAGARRMVQHSARRLEHRALRIEGQLRRLAAASRLAGAGGHAPRVRPRTAAEGAHVVYFSAGGRLCALRADRGGVTLVRNLAPVHEIEQLLRLFHYQMEVRGSGARLLGAYRDVVLGRARAHLEALGRLLLDPVLPAARLSGPLRITPYGCLFRAPFHALPWGGAPLVERAEVAIVSRPFVAAPGDLGSRRGALVMGYSAVESEAIERESREVAALLEAGGAAPRLRIGPEARREAVLEHAAGAALLHLSGHAVYRPEHPEFSALQLSDGWLHARDLAELPLDGAVVVLSACETGPRGAVAGEELLGLVRGLEQAGARAVIASLWRVDDRETLGFMQALYEGWRRSGRLGSALRGVQSVAAARTADPYLWAPFCLLGDPSAPWPGSAREEA